MRPQHVIIVSLGKFGRYPVSVLVYPGGQAIGPPPQAGTLGNLLGFGYHGQGFFFCPSLISPSQKSRYNEARGRDPGSYPMRDHNIIIEGFFLFQILNLLPT